MRLKGATLLLNNKKHIRNVNPKVNKIITPEDTQQHLAQQ